MTTNSFLQNQKILHIRPGHLWRRMNDMTKKATWSFLMSEFSEIWSLPAGNRLSEVSDSFTKKAEEALSQKFKSSESWIKNTMCKYRSTSSLKSSWAVTINMILKRAKMLNTVALFSVCYLINELLCPLLKHITSSKNWRQQQSFRTRLCFHI